MDKIFVERVAEVIAKHTYPSEDDRDVVLGIEKAAAEIAKMVEVMLPNT